MSFCIELFDMAQVKKEVTRMLENDKGMGIDDRTRN
jgi:hypothetical protein